MSGNERRTWRGRGLRDHVLPRTLTLIATYRCTAACEHCCFECTPKSEGTLSLDAMIEAIDAAARLGSVRTVVFSGGECFLMFDDLRQAILRATAHGMGTRCVTNGYWAKSKRRGRALIERLQDAGLGELNISTGDQHARFVPLKAVENAAALGVEAGMVTRVVVEEFVGRSTTKYDLCARPMIRTLLAANEENSTEPLFDVLESPWMPMDHEVRIESEHLLTTAKLPVCKGCRSIFTTIVRAPEGSLGICCGLSRRLIPELNQPFEADRLPEILSECGENFLKIWLYTDGPERIIAWAAGHDPEIQWQNRFAHQCHACLALFKDPRISRVIRKHFRERVDDVLLRYSVLLRQQDRSVEGARERNEAAAFT
ncbi:MAG TPA: radical SAM protein [Roseovarius sp.]